MSEPTRESPFPKRLWAWFQERFPLHWQGMLIVSYYSSNQFLAQVLTRPGEPVRYTAATAMGAVALLCMFFHLRVFDEHKDYEDDCRYFPKRVLQRGLVTLGHLKILGAVAIATEFAMAAIRGVPALVAVAMAFAFSLLMLKEFFASAWLKRHFLVYATSHMLIMPLLSLVVFSFTTLRFPWEAPPVYWLYAWVGFFVTFNWEVSRKIRAPEEEIEGVETYTRIFGTYGAAWIVLAIRVVDTGMVALAGWNLGLGWGFYAFLVALFVVCLQGFLQYRFRTTPKNAKRMELYAGMYIVAFDLSLAIAVAHKYHMSRPW